MVSLQERCPSRRSPASTKAIDRSFEESFRIQKHGIIATSVEWHVLVRSLQPHRLHSRHFLIANEDRNLTEEILQHEIPPKVAVTNEAQQSVKQFRDPWHSIITMTFAGACLTADPYKQAHSADRQLMLLPL